VEFSIAIALAFLEITFITTGLLLLHGLRNQIGKTAFYLALGALFVFIQMVSTTELKVIIGYSGADFYVANSILFLPLLAAVMVVYITEGTIVTQRLIIGAIAVFGFYIYISYITSIQCSWNGFHISQGPTANSLEYVLVHSLVNMTGTIAALVLDLFLIPIFYQRLRNLGARVYFAVLGSLMFTQIMDSILSLTISYWNNPQWWIHISSTYIARALATIWLSALITMYLTRVEKDIFGQSRKTLDIIFSFLGGHRKTQALQKNIIEWEGRYRMVIENVSDMILILDKNGKILDANPSTLKILSCKSKDKLINTSFFDIVETFKILPCMWRKLWNDAEQSKNGFPSTPLSSKQIAMKNGENEKIELDASFSKILIHNKQVLIVVCRNFTERNLLIKEKNELKEQLYHVQRVESLGRLAGGIAHEFNNILHALQGHIDIILLFCKIEDESAKKHLNSVISLVEKAGNITVQLLGFARKSKFQQQTINLRDVLQSTKEMFMPLAHKQIKLSMDIPEYDCIIKGDTLQLQQVFLNLLINAMDAIEHNIGRSKRISLELKTASKFTEDWKPLKADADPNDYYQIVVEDNGSGMKKETMDQIFEPFFTTKEVGKGTGMGLAMAYGEITNHKGFMHVKSQKDLGTAFFIYIPAFREEEIRQAIPKI
jgi:signal transduction histidine kinase/PAS domain-containing protein